MYGAMWESSDLTGAASSPGRLLRGPGADLHKNNSSRLTLPTVSGSCSVCRNIKMCRISENSIFLYWDTGKGPNQSNHHTRPAGKVPRAENEHGFLCILVDSPYRDIRV